MDVQLLENMATMSFDGGQADIQQVCDLLIRTPLGDNPQNFALAIGERVVAVLQASLLQPADITRTR